jgi:hypothetical protein
MGNLTKIIIISILAFIELMLEKSINLSLPSLFEIPYALLKPI